MSAAAAAPAVDLAELAAIANSEHTKTEMQIGRLRNVFRSAAQHAMAAGDALLEAKDHVPAGEWGKWQRDNLIFAGSQANTYMRLAAYRKDVELWIEDGGNGSIQGATKFLSSFPGLQAKTLKAPDLAQEAKRLAGLGMSRNGIAKTLGVSWTSAAEWTDRKYAVERAKKKREDRIKHTQRAKALARVERDKAVKKAAVQAGDRATAATSKAYGLIRSAVSELDRVAGKAEDAETKRLLASAIRHLHHAEDDIVAALRIERVR